MHRREFKMKVWTITGIVAGMVTIGTVLFSFIEKWSVIDSFYFVIMTATTIGYGDVVPTHNLSKILTVLYAISIVPLFLYSFSMIARYQVHRVYKKVHSIEVKQRQQKEEIEKTEKQINSQKRKLRETEKELDEQEKILEKEKKLNKKQEKLIQEHDEELDNFEKAIKKKKINSK